MGTNLTRQLVTKDKKLTDLNQAKIIAIDRIKGRVSLAMRNGLVSTGVYLYDLKDLRAGMTVLVVKANSSYVILNKIEAVPRQGVSYSLYDPSSAFVFEPHWINVTIYGEMPRLEWPYGYEHLLVGTLYEGWSINYIVEGQDHNVYCIYDDRSQPIVIPISYEVLDSWNTKVIVNTPDNILQITFLFINHHDAPWIDIDMTVENISAMSVSDIVLKRHNDIDVDTGGWATEDHSGVSRTYTGCGWADFYNYFDIEDGKAVAYNVLDQNISVPIPLGSGLQAHKFICYGVPTPAQTLIDNWNDWYQRANIIDDGDLGSYPTYGDWMISLTWNLGTLVPSQHSSTVRAVYKFDPNYTLTAPET